MKYKKIMINLIFATQNLHKLEEVKLIVPKIYNVVGLDSNIFTSEIPETGNTLTENAIQKARYVHERTKQNCFADDTGLEIEALNNKPGVFSARYAGEDKNSEKNIQKVLTEMSNIDNRNARFKTVIALILNNNEFLFEGIINGSISYSVIGKKGFGYDPIFIPNNYNISFAEMNLLDKNKISHRAIAVNKLVEFLISRS